MGSFTFKVFFLICGLGISTVSKVFSQVKEKNNLTNGNELNNLPPKVTYVSAVASDIICIEIDACQLLPIKQVPYHAEPHDSVRINSYTPLKEIWGMTVTRNGSPLGWLVGKDHKTLMVIERVIGDHLNTAQSDSISSYLISSPGDPEFSKVVHPTNVWRKTKPSDWAIDNSWPGKAYTAKHYLYLKLPYQLKAGQAYNIQLPALNLNRSSVTYVHDPVNVRSDAVHVSQIGFRADDPYKSAYLSTWLGTGGNYSYPQAIEFSLVDDKTNQRVFTGQGVMQWKGNIPEGIGTPVNHSGTDVIRMDFSSFKTPGRYRLCVEGIGCGYAFNIGDENTWQHAFQVSMKGLFVQRSGISMGFPYTDFVRPRSFHPADGVKFYQSTTSLMNSGNGLNALGTDKNNFKNLCEGITDKLVEDAWSGTMDAGDWDRRIQHLAVPRLLFELLELNPDYFKTLSLNIPESGNDLPDIVDEAIYGLDIYRRLQMPDGGIRGGIESSEHPSGDLSWYDQFTNMVYAPDHWSSFIYAGVASRAAVALKKLGKAEAANMWMVSAIKAMQWAEAEYQKSISDPNYQKISERAQKAIAKERNLAAVELYRLTQDKRWHQVYLSSIENQRNGTEAAFVYVQLDKSLVDKNARKIALKAIMDEADKLVDLSGKSAYGLTTAAPGRALGSWSADYAKPASPTLVRAHYLSGNPVYLKAMLRSSLFSAGANPMNLCLTTGLGENPVIHPLHVDSRFFGQPAPIGITVSGPCEVAVYAPPTSTEGKRLNAECTPLAVTWPSAESYFDVYRWAGMNEYVVDGTILSSAYIWGYLASRKN